MLPQPTMARRTRSMVSRLSPFSPSGQSESWRAALDGLRLGGATGGPGAALLEGRRRAEDERILQASADDLQAHGEATRGPAGRDGDRGLAAVIERIAERPAEMGHLAARHLARADDAEREGRQPERGREQQIVALEKSPER